MIWPALPWALMVWIFAYHKMLFIGFNTDIGSAINTVKRQIAEMNPPVYGIQHGVRKMMEKFLNIRNSLTKKLIYSYLIIVFVPIMAGVLYLNQYTRKEVEQNYVEAFFSSFQQIDNAITERVDSCKLNTSLIRWDQKILDFIQTESFSEAYTAILTSGEIILPKLAMLKSQNKYIYSIRILHGNKSIPTFADVMYYDERINSSYWTDKLMQLDIDNRIYYDKVCLESVHLDERYGIANSAERQNVFSIYRPLYSINLSRFTGIIEINMRASDILEPLVSDDMTSRGTIVLTDRQGLVLYNNTNGFEGLSQAYLDKEKNQSFRTNLRGTDYLVMKKHIASIQSWMVYYIPLNKLNIQGNYKVLFLVALIICFVTFSLFSLFLSRILLGNLMKLTRVIDVVKSGNLNVKADIRSSDEIGMLGKNFNEMVTNIQNLMERVKKANTAEKEAIYKALDNQIKPHFLSNALDMIRITAEKNHYLEISNWISSFMNYFLYVTAKSDRYVTLKDELKNAVDYIEIYNLIGRNKIEYTIELGDTISGRLMEYKLMKFILQPIVENAIVHGFFGKNENCFLTFTVKTHQDRIAITLEDNGCGMSVERLRALRSHIDEDMDDIPFATSGSGIGLKNIHQRLKLNFGEGYELFIQSSPLVGTQVTIEILEDLLRI